MSERTYNRLANILMLIAVGSAVLFDSGKFPHVVVGMVGVLAGVAALALYFWNQHEVSEKEEESDSSQQEATVAVVKAAEAKPPGSTRNRGVRFFVDDFLIAEKPIAVRTNDVWRIAALDTLNRRVMAQAWLAHYSDNYARTLRWSAAKGEARVLMQPEVELSPCEVAACAIEIMRNLAVSDDFNSEWEYSFGPKGLRVSLKKAHSVRPIVPQEDFDFGDISSLVQ